MRREQVCFAFGLLMPLPGTLIIASICLKELDDH